MTLEPNINELLPPEVLVQVLERLPPRSLLVAVLVCPLWLHLAEQAPQLWTWLHLTVWPGDLDSVIPILGSPRFCGIRRLRLRSLSDHLLSALLLNQINLVEVSLLGTNVASVSPELLAFFVVGIPRVDMVATLTDQRHISAIIAAVGGKEIKIQELNFSGNDLSQVAGKYLAGAVCNLNKLNISTTNLSEGQMEEIFLALNKQRRVSSLSIRRSQVGHLPTSLFVRAVLQLKEVDLGLTNMSSDQLSVLCAALPHTRSLQKLDLTGLCLSQLEPRLLAEGLARLTEAGIRDCDLTVEQEREVLSFAIKEGTLKRLTMSQVRPENECLFQTAAQKICLVTE